MLLYRSDVLKHRRIEPDPLRAEDQFMQVLAVGRFDLDAGANILRHEGIVEDRNMRKRLAPGAVLKHVRCRALPGDDDMRRMLRSEALPLVDQNRITRAERPQDGRQRRLAPAVLRVHERQLAEWQLRSRGDIIELPDIAQKLNSIDEHAPP